jgi:hypothetical protein
MVMKRTQILGIVGIGTCIFVIFALINPLILILAAGFLAGSALLYVVLSGAPTQYEDEEQEMTEDEILFVYDD